MARDAVTFAALPATAVGPPDADPHVSIFAYHRSLGPLVGAILGLACVEAFVVHIVAMAYWGWKIAVGLGLLDISFVVALIWLLRSFKRCPIMLQDDRLIMRTGVRLRVAVDVDNIAGFRATWSAGDIKAPHVLNMALIAWPNIVIDLHRPILRRRKSITTIAHCVDDPAAFRRAVLAALPAAHATEDR